MKQNIWQRQLITPRFPLTEEEVQAIAYHDGQYAEYNRSVATYEENLAESLCNRKAQAIGACAFLLVIFLLPFIIFLRRAEW